MTVNKTLTDFNIFIGDREEKMKTKLGSLLMIGIFVFTSLTAFGAENKVPETRVSPAAVAESNALFASYNYNMEYCTVSLGNPRSNLNVRTWEGRVIGKLRHGTRVWVSEYSGEWARVSVRRGRRWVAVGWVDSNYLFC